MSEEVNIAGMRKLFEVRNHSTDNRILWDTEVRNKVLPMMEEIETLRSTNTSLQSRLETAEARHLEDLKLAHAAGVPIVSRHKSATYEKPWERNANPLWFVEFEYAIDPTAESRAQQAEEMRDRAVDQLEKLTFHIQWYLELTTTRPDGTSVKPLVPANRSSVEIEAAKLTLEKLLTSPPSGRTDGEREAKGDCRCLACGRFHFWNERNVGPVGGHTYCPTLSCSHARYEKVEASLPVAENGKGVGA